MIKAYRQKQINGKPRPIYRLGLFLLFLLSAFTCAAQKYTFRHYDIEDGLIESQVNSIASDSLHRLWLATDGGAALFNGKEFQSYNRQNGLSTNFVNDVFVDKAGAVWFGTQNGLLRLAGKTFSNLTGALNLPLKHVSVVQQDAQGAIWFIMNYRLYKVTVHGLSIQMAGDSVTSLAINRSGKVYCTVFHKGIFCQDNGNWTEKVPLGNSYRNIKFTSLIFDNTDPDRLYLVAEQGIYIIANNQVGAFSDKSFPLLTGPFYALCQDHENNFWIGTGSGAYYLSGNKLTRFSAANGFTDNPVTNIYEDPDHNLWLATQGDGFYKYGGGQVAVFDMSQGLPDKEVVMCISRDSRAHIIFGIYAIGIMQYDGQKISALQTPQHNTLMRRARCSYTDKDGNVWIGTDAHGIWVYDDHQNFHIIPGSQTMIVNAIMQDSEGTRLISTSTGCYYMANGLLRQMEGFHSFARSMLPLNHDSVIVATHDGILLAVKNRIGAQNILKEAASSAIFCMHKYKNTILLGTDDRGIFTWDISTKKVKNLTVKDGLNSNTIYSMAHDPQGIIWVGTGRGVNKLIPGNGGAFSISNAAEARNEMVESNENAILYADKKIWVGTTKGLFVYNTVSASSAVKPHITIQSVRLILQGPENTGSNAVFLGNGARIDYNNRHLAITFLGIKLDDPQSIAYSYRLKGSDTGFSQPLKNNVVDYPALPPGDYTFQVKAMNTDGTLPSNTASISFTILPPFYQTAWFRVLAILFFILIGVGIQTYRYHLKLSRAAAIEDAKNKESLRIRQQTAADFHDELGNQLTRITVLSEILGTRLNDDEPEQRKLLDQIKSSALSLYNGTREILWALNPKSDNLYEILCHIRIFGSELFMDTQIDFNFEDFPESLKEIKMPMECSRNLPAIFKELLNNVLKHSGATTVDIRISHIEKHEIKLTMRDNGSGFDFNAEREGQGLNNIINRTKRIGGTIYIDPKKSIGTTVNLIVNI